MTTLTAPAPDAAVTNCAITWAFGLPVDHIGRLIALAVVKHCARDGTAYPSMATLAELVGVDRRTVADRIARLIAAGAIEDTGRTVGRGVRVLRAVGYRPWTPSREGRTPARAALAKPMQTGHQRQRRPAHPGAVTCASGGRDLSIQHAHQLQDLNYQHSAHQLADAPAVDTPTTAESGNAAPAAPRGVPDAARQRIAEAKRRMVEAPKPMPMPREVRTASVSRPANVVKTGLEGGSSRRPVVPPVRNLLACLPTMHTSASPNTRNT